MVPLARYRFSVDDFHRMAEAGVLAIDDRVELLDGEVLVMAPIGSPHAACVSRLTLVLAGRVGSRAIVRVQSPVRLTTWSEPQPDLALARSRADFYAGDHPGPTDILLVIEVSDTSLRYDREVKLPLYAAAGVPEAWIVDLLSETVTAHREPGPAGYGSVAAARRGDVLRSLALPDLEVAVADVLP